MVLGSTISRLKCSRALNTHVTVYKIHLLGRPTHEFVEPCNHAYILLEDHRPSCPVINMSILRVLALLVH